MPRSSGSSGPTIVRSIALALGECEQRVGIAGIDGDQFARPATMPAIARRADDCRRRRFARELPGQRVLAAAAADDQDLHRPNYSR